jgi:hypothetical protein
MGCIAPGRMPCGSWFPGCYGLSLVETTGMRIVDVTTSAIALTPPKVNEGSRMMLALRPGETYGRT